MCVGQFYDYAISVPNFLPESLQNGLNNFQQQTCVGLKEVFAKATEISSSPGALKDVLKGFNAVLDITNTCALQPILPQVSKNFTVVQDFILATGIFSSGHYFLSGTFYQDVVNQNGFRALTELCLAVGKIGVTATWLQKQVSLDLGYIADTVGSVPYFGVVANLRTFPLLDYSLIAASAIIISEQFYKMYTGGFTFHGALTVANNVSDIALTSLGLVGEKSMLIMGGLALICATTALCTFLIERSRPAA